MSSAGSPAWGRQLAPTGSALLRPICRSKPPAERIKAAHKKSRRPWTPPGDLRRAFLYFLYSDSTGVLVRINELCARMRWAIELGLEHASIGVVTTPGTKTPKYVATEPRPLTSWQREVEHAQEG